MSNLGDRFRLTFTTHGENADAAFIAAIHDRGWPFVQRASWPTSERDLTRVGRAMLVETQEGHTSGLWERDDMLIRLTFDGIGPCGVYVQKVTGTSCDALGSGSGNSVRSSPIAARARSSVAEAA